MGDRLLAALCAALLGWFVGKALGVPVWRDWNMGDRSDLAVLSFFCVWFAIGSINHRAPSAPIPIAAQETVG